MFLFFDTEFSDFKFMDLLSIGIISEDGNYNFYAEIEDCPKINCSDFVKKVVFPLMNLKEHGAPYQDVANNLTTWLNSIPNNELVLLSDYSGDIFLLQMLLKKSKVNLEKKLSLLLISKGLEMASQERGFYNHLKMSDALNHVHLGASESLMKYPEMQHHALFDAKANADGFKKGLSFLKSC